MIVSDNGSGGWSGLTGSINYSTGAVTAPATFVAAVPAPNWLLLGGRYWFAGWTQEFQSLQLDETSTVSVEYLYGDALSAVSEEHMLQSCVLDFVENSGETAVSASMRLNFGGKTYIEQGGAVYADVSQATGSGVWVGSFDYASRRVTLNTWVGGVSNVPALVSLLTTLGEVAVPEVTIKVLAPPIKQSGFTLYATQLDGTAVQATVATNGDLIAAGIVGFVDFQRGIAFARFGDWITAAGHEGEPWFNAENVVGGQIFRALPVKADSIIYDATLESRTALPADVINIDTSLLPATGQLELGRNRDMLYFFHDLDFEAATPVSGAAVDCGRTYLERVWVQDSTGARVPASAYTATQAELNAGVFHWASGTLPTVAYPTPWRVFHRVSEVRVVGTFDNFGLGRLRDKPFTIDLPVGAGVASMLFAGNLGANWSQPTFWRTWTNWNAAGTGEEAVTGYDYLNFPIIVANNGATLSTRVAFVFQDATHFRVFVEGVTQVDSMRPITEDYTYVNPATGQPMFTITGNHSGNEPWGEGHSALEYMLIELVPANFPFIVGRCTQPSNPVEGIDMGRVELLGNFG